MLVLLVSKRVLIFMYAEPLCLSAADLLCHLILMCSGSGRQGKLNSWDLLSFKAKKKELVRRDETEDGDSMLSSATSDTGSAKRKRYNHLVKGFKQRVLSASESKKNKIIKTVCFPITAVVAFLPKTI